MPGPLGPRCQHKKLRRRHLPRVVRIKLPPPALENASIARKSARSTMHRWNTQKSFGDDFELLEWILVEVISELTANAEEALKRHGDRSPVVITLRRHRDYIAFKVWNKAPLTPPQSKAETDERGRGLKIVNRVCTIFILGETRRGGTCARGAIVIPLSVPMEVLMPYA